MKRILVLLMMVRRSLRQHALSTIVTVLSAALASGLVMAVFSLSEQSKMAFTGGPAGFDAVLGARGSPLQLVLNTVFHLETSPGNVPWSLYEEMKTDARVDVAIPYAVGDNFRGFRIVGTTGEIFSRFEYVKGRSFTFEPGGRPFSPERQEAVLGATAARATGLAVGASFEPVHGADHDADAAHEDEYVVVGVLEPTNSPADRVIWIPIEGMFRMSGHVLRGAGEEFHADEHAEEIPDEHKEVSAVMLKLKSPQAGFRLDQQINREGTAATLAWPIGRSVAELFEKLGFVSRVLELVAYLVVVVAGGSILASVYNTMNERRREFAILRALGARRRTVFAVIVLEAGAIALLGALLGYVVDFGIHAAAASVVREKTGVALDLLHVHPVLWWTPPVMLAVGVVAGLLPAMKAYSTDVADGLAG